MTLDFVIRLLFILLFPMISLFMLATFVYTRSHHMYIGKMVALSLTFGGLAYLFELVRMMIPIEYSAILQLFFVIFFSSISFSILAHLFYKLVTKNTAYKLTFMPYFIYSYPLFIFCYSLIELFIIGSPPYERVNGWIYRSDNFLLPNAIFVLIILCIQIWLLFIGMKQAKTDSYQFFFKICFFYTLCCLVIFALWLVLPFKFYLFVPPTPVLLFFTLTGALYALLIIKVDFIPSVIKQHTSLIDTSPIAIILFNEALTIIEANPVATEHYHLKEQQKLNSYFNFEHNPQPLHQLLSELKEKQYVIEFAISYTDASPKRRHLSINASRVIYNEETYYYWMIHDLTIKMEQRQLNEQLAFFDPLTTIYNRTYFEQTVKQQLLQHDGATESAFVLIDLNFFKTINDTYGHQIGDAVLQFTANTLQNVLPNPHILARLGGDEFIVYFEHIPARTLYENEMAHVRQLFKSQLFSTNTVTIEVIPSFGFAYTSEVGTNYDILYHTCDKQMYEDKQTIKSLYDWG